MRMKFIALQWNLIKKKKKNADIVDRARSGVLNQHSRYSDDKMYLRQSVIRIVIIFIIYEKR